jgi:hypothetical protein
MTKEEELEKQQTALAKLAVSSKLMGDDFNAILLLTAEPQSHERDKRVYELLERIERTLAFIQNTVIEDLFFEDLTPIRD